MVSKIKQAALARANIAPEDRKDFFLYIDEFQNFVTPSIESILSEARKYRLGLILAHQYIEQLKQKDLG
jgi:type IV secretory pathway TraG/TraD family ATPase VirD4